MLAIEPIWLLVGAGGAVSLVLAALLLFRKSGKDYDLARNEGPARGFDLGAQQRELNEQRAQLEAERKRGEADARNMAAQANDALSMAAEEEAEELRKLAADSAPPIFESAQARELREASYAVHEAEAQALIRQNQSEVAAIVRRQELEIERVKAEQRAAVENARAEYERARDAHFSLLGHVEPKPAIVSYAMRTPIETMADTMQASYAQVAWAFGALARKLE